MADEHTPNCYYYLIIIIIIIIHFLNFLLLLLLLLIIIIRVQILISVLARLPWQLKLAARQSEIISNMPDMAS